MPCYYNAYHKGKKALKNHKPADSVKHFRDALSECPLDEKEYLYKILFFLGVALAKLGQGDYSLKCWISSLKIRKRGHSLKMLRRYVNDFGMPRQHSQRLDEWKAFYSIQLCRYLESKKSRKIGTKAEGDMIKDLIFDHWKNILLEGKLGSFSPEEKLEFFKKEKIIFPFFVLPENVTNPLVNVDFAKHRKLLPGDRCSCGSGLPFKLCCGRTPSVKELYNGLF
jgi:hypothetical protein